MTPRVALTIAGSDSGGGAGLQADLKTMAAHRIHGTSAVTAITAQNTAAVLGVVIMEAAFVVAQIEAVLSDFTVGAVKTGMLASPETVRAVAELAERGRLPNLVVDPVLVSSSGHPLMGEGGIAFYRDLLLPVALVATPNLRETAVLTEIALDDLDDVEARIEAAQAIRRSGAQVVVVKGGHLTHDASDVVASRDGVEVLPATRVETDNDHGTGCSMSAAIASQLALGLGPLPAVRAAKAFVRAGLRGAAPWRLGAGHGPIDHFGWEQVSNGDAAAPT